MEKGLNIPEGNTKDYAKMTVCNFYMKTSDYHVAMMCALHHVENIMDILKTVHENQYAYDFKQSYTYTWWKDVYDYIDKGVMNF